MMRIHWLALTTFAPLLAGPGLAQSSNPDASLPVRRVTLYTSGVGYFERAGDVSGNSALTLQFPVEQVNDVLKSLVLLDSGGGSIQPVTFGAQDPLSRQLQSFRVDLSDNPDRATLLNRLRGAPVTVTLSDGGLLKSLSGVIVGVETQTLALPNGGGTVPQASLTLNAADGLHTLRLDTITAVKIDDPQLAEDIRKALNAVSEGRDANKRPVRLAFKGHGRREVRVGYLTEAPLWQTTYRLVLGKSPTLQGWALVQNTGQDDWDGVNLTLVSGQPISFIQDLYTPLYVPRPTIQTRIAQVFGPVAYKDDLTDRSMFRKGGTIVTPGGTTVTNGAVTEMAAPATPMMPAPSAPMASVDYYAAKRADADKPMDAAASLQKQMQTSGAKLGTALFSYSVKVPVTIPRRQSAMIPFLSAPLQAESVTIFNPEVNAEHPLSGARIKNTSGLHLMGGPLTVFDDGPQGAGYVGDALIDDTEPNQTRLISYSVDLAVDAHAEPGGQNEQTTALSISQGVLWVQTRTTQTTKYLLKNHSDHARKAVLEQPFPGEDWKLLEPSAATERTATLWRFDVPVPAGKSVSYVVKSVHPDTETYALVDEDLDSLIAYSKSGEASQEVKEALREVIQRRQAFAAIQTQIRDLQSRRKAVAEGQTRIRENMKALDHASALYKRYADELNRQETQIEALDAKIDALSGDLAAKRKELSEAVAQWNKK